MIKKPYKKLIAASLLAVISITMMVTATYAWFSLAGSPALTGVQINVGGDNTIMLAPDMSVEVDGQMIHYPGEFQKTMNIVREDSYKYLKELNGLSPVSTADGIHWFVPTAAEAGVSDVLSLEDFTMDTDLTYANQTEGTEGGYAYVDFWVVSPMDNCTLRISTGGDGEGSYLIQLPDVVADASTDIGYRLNMENGTIAACARVGFLINNDQLTDNLSMQSYIDSDEYNETYKSLRGIYQEPGTVVNPEMEYSFLIYEPNGDVHTGEGIAYIQTENGFSMDTCEDGSYMVTNPIAYENGERVLKDVKDILQVQKGSIWTKAASDEETTLEQLFRASLIGKNTSTWTEEDYMTNFYGKYLQNQYSQYVTPGEFFAETWSLYYSGNSNKTSADMVSTLDTSTTVQDARLIKLERNVPQRIRMYIWLEGQDVDCNSTAALEYFTLGIELAGSTED